MSAVPKKKLCWNCEGNVAKNVDNCPYCGVYIHAVDEENSGWRPSYHSSEEEEEIPTPLYQIQENEQNEFQSKEQTELAEGSFVTIEMSWTLLKKDILPTLFLMSGSIFFLFGVVLLLFSQEGTLTLQWKSHYWSVFLGLSLPFIFLGWRFLQTLENE
ncbi:Uncharacterized protein PRO82_000608 [Candidatus Protochlamydia amoebophila]|uniref:Uncharacterized protein n=1 Tax=Protochlamydia amoebophila (strain UWE25) TaxID=264201 RepID=Q6MEX5_PARUW|nr:hypothetical protein [Candidatus Protochlamydia amoebophila]MBS4163308.1 Uncharacterized protein [Candidatus Protochlamydia amoebophila]CAF22874.1 unnamed protein product [Candidatus Protochlamydia amoebophila UWE25]